MRERVAELEAMLAGRLERKPDDSQEWAKVDGAIAFHLIERHADDWNDAGRMMEAWRDANPRRAPAEDAREQQPDDADNLSVMLWLLRRLPRAYGNPPFVEQAINRLAKRTGTDVADSFAERNDSCRATGTDRAQAGEAPAGAKEEGKEG